MSDPAFDILRSCFCSNEGCSAAGKCLGTKPHADPFAGYLRDRAQEIARHASVEYPQALCAADVLSEKLDREPWSGKVHDSVRLAVAEQILRSIRDEQIGASSTVKALAASYFVVME
jgi:hypothetical protein